MVSRLGVGLATEIWTVSPFLGAIDVNRFQDIVLGEVIVQQSRQTYE